MKTTQRGHLVQGFENLLASVATLAFNNPLRALALALVMTTAGIYSARNLGLDADLSELLPKTFPSVEGLEELKKRFGGIGFVVVVGQSKDPKALRQFADDLAPKLEKLPDVRWVDYKRPTQFIEDHILYFIDTPDLQKLSDQLAARMEYERRSRNPLYLDFEDDGPPEFSLDELGNKYSGKSDSSWLEAQLVDEYYADDERGMVLLLVKPGSMSIDLDYAKKVVDQVKAETARLDMTPYGEDFKVGWAGTYVKKVDQQELIQSDLQLATWVAFALMLLYLAFHFRRITAVFLIVIPLSMGLVWTYAFAAIVFVKLNILTGFIGAILLGLGIDHGIHLLGRYEHEFGFAKTPLEAIQKAFSSTGRAVSMAALTTLVAFAGLGMSEFVAFREFGVIAAAGMVLVVAAYMLTLPALLALADKYGWKPASGKKHLVAPVFAPLGKFAVPVMAVSLAIFAILTMLVPTAHFNHDAQSLAASQLPSFDLDLETNEILGYSQTPLIVLTENITDERNVAKAFRKRSDEMGENSTIDFIAAGADLVPLNQEEKYPIVQTIGESIKGVKTKWLPKEYRTYFKKLKRMVKAKPYTRQDVPIEIRRQFQSEDGMAEDGFVLVFPGVALHDGEKVIKFAKEIRDVPMPEGGKISASGEALIMADIFEMVGREATPILGFTILAVILTLWLLLGRLRDAMLALIPAAFTLISTLGLLNLVGQDLNYLNVVMIPVLFGIGVDGGVHLVTRFNQGEANAETLTEVGRAVAGAILTTSLGFGALLLANHHGLNSLGSLAVLGLSTNILGALVVLPSVLIFLQKKQESVSEQKTESASITA